MAVLVPGGHQLSDVQLGAKDSLCLERLGVARYLEIARLRARIIGLRLRPLPVLPCQYGRLKGPGDARMASRLADLCVFSQG